MRFSSMPLDYRLVEASVCSLETDLKRHLRVLYWLGWLALYPTLVFLANPDILAMPKVEQWHMVVHWVVFNFFSLTFGYMIRNEVIGSASHLILDKLLRKEIDRILNDMKARHQSL